MTAPGSLLRWNWAVAAAAIVLISMMCMPPLALGQASSQGQGISSQAVSAVGPTEVVEITAEKLALAAGRNKPVVIDLRNKTVVVKDLNGQYISLTAISPGMSVGVLNEASSVTIRVAPKMERKNDKFL